MTQRSALQLPTEVYGHRSPGWWGLMMFVATDTMIFVNLIVTYFTLRFRAPVWPPDGTPKPDLLIPGIATVILILSSVPMQWADMSIGEGHQGRTKLGLALSFILGATFLGIQANGALHWPFSLGSSAYSSVFIILTGFHATHVLIGLVINAVTQLLVWLGYYNQRRRLGVRVTALFWHFVDGVWIFVFATLHLSPYSML